MEKQIVYLQKTHFSGEIEVVAFNFNNLTSVSAYYDEILFETHDELDDIDLLFKNLINGDYKPCSREFFNSYFIKYVGRLNEISKEL